LRAVDSRKKTDRVDFFLGKRYRDGMATRSVADRRRDAVGQPKTKGQRTRARIVREAAELFNVRGYAGTSVADVSSAVGLEKGGVYNHFESKDALALACFEYAAGAILSRVREATVPPASAWDRIQAVFDVYRRIAEQRFVKGGCPILNTAVEADDTHPGLSARARGALNSWRTILVEIMNDGTTAGEFTALASSDEIAATIIAGLEGGVMLSKIYRDPTYMRTVTAQLTTYLRAVLSFDAR
jgi:TetR/AcrR family transcriptional regulator, transcriptional repressor for nem operon